MTHPGTAAPTCRACDAPLKTTFVDLGMSPPCENFLSAGQLDQVEHFFPLHVRICDECLLVQLPAYLAADDIFTHYAYFSSFSDSWVEHTRRFVDSSITRLGLDETSFVVEVASNDGYLLQHVVAAGIPTLGIEPAANVAQAAIERGVPTTVEFLGAETGAAIREQHGPADLVVANNVIAHVPDINDFSRGLRALVADGGSVSIEIPHLAKLISHREFDTIYHEHFSYLSLLATQRILGAAGLTVVDVEEISTHGGSLRTWSQPTEHADTPSSAVATVLDAERGAGLHTVEGHAGFATSVAEIRDDLMRFLIDCRRDGKTVAGYGAPGKGNTLLNYCGIRPDLMSFTVDRNPFKHGKYLPGTHIPVFDVAHLSVVKPDVIVILPWNLRTEIVEQLAYTREWGAQLVVPLPTLEIV